MDFLAPTHEGDELTAVAVERWRARRTGIYDVSVANQLARSLRSFAVVRISCESSLTVNVELLSGVESQQASRVSGELVQRIKSYIGVTTVVVVHPANSIERSVGKAKRVSDRRRLA